MEEGSTVQQVRETVLDAPCPGCGHRPLKYLIVDLDLPYFGDALQTTILCEECGFKHADVLILSQKEPVHYEMRISGEEDLCVRVVRSSSGTIRIPEVGMEMEPGPLSEAFVSNVEGVLMRFVDILSFLQRTSESEAERERIMEIFRFIGLVRSGKKSATLVLEDPLGNSAILSDKATKRRLTEDEIKNLKTGILILEK